MHCILMTLSVLVLCGNGWGWRMVKQWAEDLVGEIMGRGHSFLLQIFYYNSFLMILYYVVIKYTMLGALSNPCHIIFPNCTVFWKIC
jgi:hypothetical protein